VKELKIDNFRTCQRKNRMTKTKTYFLFHDPIGLAVD
jgi:hypothetical protein